MLDHNNVQCDFIRKQIWDMANVEYWYKQNISIYVKKDKVELVSFDAYCSMDGMSVCHPDALLTAVTYYEEHMINWVWFKNHMPHLHKLYRLIKS